MKILLIGDIVGRPGRETVKKVLPSLRKETGVDFVIANAENLNHGNGFASKNIEEMKQAGIDFFTSGDHTWGNREGAEKLDDKNFPVIRPANFPEGVPGKGYKIINVEGKKILIMNLIGRVFMKKDYDCPFRKAEKILSENEKVDHVIVDIHAEASSEKYALAYFLDGKVSAIFGTHTHVPTRDLQILPLGTAFVSDVGMTGPYESVIGVKKDVIIDTFLTQIPHKHDPEERGRMIFNAVVVELDSKKRKALNIDYVQKII